MSVPMKKHLTNKPIEFKITGFAGDPSRVLNEFEKVAQKYGLKVENEEYCTIEDIFPNSHPGRLLAGCRYREGLTQTQLSQLTGIPQRHISEMENGKREIGKARAKILAKALNTNYKHFL